MKAKLLMTIAIFSLVLAREQVYSQAAAAPQARLDPNMISFFTGHWKGAGEFAGGAKIAADVDFTLTLDSCWLLYEHRDQAPNTYKATSMWGVDGKTGQLLAYTFDNFHGHRQWMSNGWVDGKLVLSGGSFTRREGWYSSILSMSGYRRDSSR
jgi:hypothetical protein